MTREGGISGDRSIRVTSLSKRFGDKVVLSGVDLAIEAGQVFGYVGPNGAGKSTTVKILVGMLQDFEGDVRVAGIDVAKDPLEVKRIIGYVPENAQLYESLTPAEYLEFVARLHELDEPTLQRRALALLEAFDLGTRAHTRIGTLSKGMRQKVLLASALIHDPQVLVLDEPLSGLDVRSMIVVKELIRGFADSGRTVLYCSHVMDVVERVCDRIAILDRGAIVAAGSFEELAAIAQQSSLEQVFRKLTGGGDEAEQATRILAAIDR
jgi:ABC-2 type transport system ATP-binding protein